MSFDLAGASGRCDHLQVLERYAIDPFDFRTLHVSGQTTLNMRAPINGAANVRIYLKGTLVYPDDPLFGFSVVPDDNRVQAEPGYQWSKIVFNAPVRMLSSLIEVTYFTRQGFCLKCGATGAVADWSVSTSGALRRTTGVKKLAQQSLKYVLTSNNPFNPTLVCPIRTYLGKKITGSITDEDISSAVATALTTYQSIQRAQKTVQTLDPAEMLKAVTSVSTRQDPDDPTRFYVAISITAYGSTETIPLALAFETNQ